MIKHNCGYISSRFIKGLLLIFAVVFGLNAFANDSHNKDSKPHEEDTFDPTKVIFGHISDSHDWHLWGDHEDAVSIPLPVIIYSDKGLDFFMSSAFHHGTAAYHGKYNYVMVEGKIQIVGAEGVPDLNLTSNIVDLSITKNVASMFLSMIIILWIFLSVAKAYKNRGISAPKGLQSFIEPLIVFIKEDIVEPNIGPKADRFLPFLLTVFFFIWINNLLGLLPFGANLSGNIAFTLTLAVITLLVTNLNGNKDYWKHIFWMPGLSWPMKLFMAPIELIGILTKPFALMIRLFANITAGHIVVISLISLIFIFKSLAIAPISVAFALFIDVLELLVAFLQAYIFTMLTALFIGSAVAEHAHEGEHGHH